MTFIQRSLANPAWPGALMLFGTILLLFATAACDCGSGAPSLTCRGVGSPCITHSDCCSFGCDPLDRICVCNPEVGGICRGTADCCDGYLCAKNECIIGCRDNGEACESDWGCCSGLCEEGQCARRTDCAYEEEACAYDDDCCDSLRCREGLCSEPWCKDILRSCSTDEECCSPLRCHDGTCYCGRFKDPCDSDEECCDLSPVCRDGFCRRAECNTHTSAACIDDSDCCLGTCVDGHCCSDEGGECDYYLRCCDAELTCMMSVSQCRVCLDVGESCNWDRPEECCSGNCRSGACCLSLQELCAGDEDCCSGNCIGGRCCSPARATCEAGGDACCGELVCGGLGPSPNCCLTTGSACDPLNNHCCFGDFCRSEVCCSDAGTPCHDSEDCCSGLCRVDGVCDCTPAGSERACKLQTDCCGEARCAGDRCCYIRGHPCTSTAECCDGLCAGVPVRCCKDAGGACTYDSDCCSDSCHPQQRRCQ